MMKGVSDMACLARHGHLGVGVVNARDVLERIEVGRQNLFFTVFLLDERTATIAYRFQGSRVAQKMSDRGGNLRSGTYCDPETFALDYAVRIDKRHDGDAPDPGLEVGIRESFDIRGIDQYFGPAIQVTGVPIRQASVKRHVGFGGSRVSDIPEQSFFAGQGPSHHVNFHLRQSLGEFENPVRPLYASDVAYPQHVDIAGGNRLGLLHQHSRHPTLLPLYASDVAYPQHVDIAGGNRLGLLHQHPRHPTRQTVVARQSLRLRSALHENGIGSPQTVCIKPAVASKGYEQAGSVTIRIARSAKDESLAMTPAEQSH